MMKKILMISVAILTIATVKAQEVHFGVKGGLNLAGLSVKDTSYKASFYVGALAEYQFLDNLSGEVGVQFVDNGASQKEENKTIKNSVYQINVPVSVKYSIAEGLGVKGGLYAGYITSMSIDGESFDISKKDFNRFDYGLSVGAEYALPMGVFFETNYNLGLSELGIKGYDIKNRVFQLGVGYKF